MLEEDEVLRYYDHWKSIIMYFFQIRDPSSIDDDEWFDKVERWRDLDKHKFLPVKLKE